MVQDSPKKTSQVSSHVYSAWKEMVGAENQGLRERVHDLEKKVMDQTDEITCLRSTLADALRRITSMETARVITGRGPSTNGSSGGRGGLIGHSPSPAGVRLRGNVSDKARDPNRRATSYISGRGEAPQGRSSANSTSRRSHMFQSSSSLYSDGHSSSSASPAPSPSPTHHHPLTSTLNNRPHYNNNNNNQNNVINSNCYSSTTVQNTSCATTSSHTALFLSRSSQSLTKRWNSTMDFTAGTAANGSPSGNGHNGATTTYSNVGQQSPAASTNLSRRQNGGGSLHNLSNLRHSTGFSPAPPTPLKQSSRRDPLFLADEGVVRVYIRGRPVTLCVPSHLRQTFTAATPAPPPPARLELDWVYGYRGRDCRNNLEQLPTGELVYFVAAVAVLYGVEDQMQRHYLGHTDDIKCLAVHPNRMIVATGQTAGNNRLDTRSWRLHPPSDPYHPSAENWPHIRIWDSVSLSTLHILGISDFERSVSCLAFSRTDSGSMLVAVDDAADHNISLWEWARGERGYKVLESKCSSDPVLAVEFSPVDRHTIITCGRAHITFWQHENGMLAKRQGVFETRQKPKYVTAIAFLNTGDLLSGDSNGNLLIWYRGGNTVAHSVRGAHAGAILSILVQNSGNVVTAGKDGRILEWDPNLNSTGNVMKVPELFGFPRVITNGRGSRLIVGTTRNCILGGTFALPLQPLVQGHCEEVWALACHPSQQQFLTGGYDRTCILWDSMSHTQVWTTNFTEPVQCGAFSPCGGVVVVGGVSGYWAAMDAQTRELRQENRDGTHPIQVMRFSPDGQYLAVGSRDGNIYMYQVMDDLTRFARIGKCQGHASAVLHLDWSKDCQYLQSNSTDYDLLFWNAPICRQLVQSSQLRDVEWTTRTCPVSFHSFGAWLDDGIDVLSACQAAKSDVVVAGDIVGNITLLSSPACHQKATGVYHSGHGSLVTNVEFLPEDTRLVSCGSREAAVMQWQLIMKQ